MNEQLQVKYRHSLIDLTSNIAIYGWMIAPYNEGGLQLKGAELSVYAVIYACSNMRGNLYIYGLSYMADWTHCTKQHIIRCLQSLQNKNYIAKYEKINNNNVKLYGYKVTKCMDDYEINGYKRIDYIK